VTYVLLAFSTATTTIPTTSSGAGEGMLRYLTEPGWKNALAEEFEKPYFKEIIRFVDQERRSSTEIFPTEEVSSRFPLPPPLPSIIFGSS